MRRRPERRADPGARGGLALLAPRTAALAIVLLCAGTAAAAPAPVFLPGGSPWVVAAPRADVLSDQAQPLLRNASRFAPSLAPARVNAELTRATGLPLLDRPQLVEAGVDVTRGWMLFEHERLSYLTVSVSDAGRLDLALTRWTRERMLPYREERELAPGKGRLVVLSRSEGARVSAGWVVSGDRAVILVDRVSTPERLLAALAAVENAAPIRPSLDAPLLVKHEVAPFGELWLAATPKADRVDLVGAARKPEPGLFSRQRGRADWLGALLRERSSSAEGAPAGWLRATAGASSERWLAALVGRFVPIGEEWRPLLAKSAAGPVELALKGLDLEALQPPPTGLGRDGWRHLVPGTLALLDRPAPLATSVLDAAAGALPSAQRPDPRTVRLESGTRAFTVRRDGGTLLLSTATPPVNRSLAPTGAPLLGCARGTPVASLRLEARQLARELGGVGLLTALRYPLLMPVFALATEYGELLRASSPLVGLVCEESSGRLHLAATLRLPPPSASAPASR